MFILCVGTKSYRHIDSVLATYGYFGFNKSVIETVKPVNSVKSSKLSKTDKSRYLYHI